MIRFVVAVLVWLLTTVGPAQAARDAERGDPPLRSWSDTELDAHFQNFSVLAASDGMVYVGNGHGVLRFDGVRWEKFPTPNATRVRRLAQTADGRLLYATIDDFGELVAQGDGTRRFESWRERLPLKPGELGDVYDVGEYSGTVVVQSSRWFAALDAGTPTLIAAQGSFQVGLRCAGRYLLLERERGLLVYVPDTHALMPLDGGAVFRDDSLLGCQDAADGSATVAFGKRGLQRFVDGRFEAQASDADAWLAQHRGLAYVALRDGGSAFASVGGGALVLDAQGHRVFVLDQASGLNSSTITALATTGDGSLWLVGEAGVSVARWPGPLTAFGRRYGLGSVQGVTRHARRLVLGTMQGVRVLLPGSGTEAPRFERVDGLAAQVWNVRDDDGVLLVAGTGGLWRTRLDDTGRVREVPTLLAAARFAYNIEIAGDMIYVSSDRGLAAVPRAGGEARWIEGGSGELRDVAIDRDGSVWAGSATQTLLHVAAGESRARTFGAKEGLAPGNVLPFRSARGVLVGGTRGLLEVAGDATFRCATDFAAEFCGDGAAINRYLELASGEPWVRRGDRTGRAQRGADSRWHFDASPLGAFGVALPLVFFEDDDATLWIGSNYHLVRYATGASSPVPNLPAPDVAALRIAAARVSLPAPTDQLPTAAGPLRFDLRWRGVGGAAPFQFRTRLIGLERAWSEWRDEAFREVSPLSGGDYALEMQARDVSLRESPVGRLAFRVATPWYAQGWAWLLWCGSVAAMLAVGARLYARNHAATLAARNRALQFAVDARTQELARRTHEVEQQNARLRELDWAKNRFFATISHEFRTPLSLILGPLRGLRRGDGGRVPKSVQRELESVERNAGELARLVDSILEINRAEQLGSSLSRSRTDAAALTRRAAALFESLAAGQGRELALSGVEQPVPACFDLERVHRAIVNLIANALKYSPPSTPIDISLTFNDSAWELCVADRGSGLAAEELERVFDLYYRGSNAYAARSVGSGIGLAFVKAVADAHGGHVCAQQRDGGGTCFRLRMPRALDGEAPLVDDTPLAQEDSILFLASSAADEPPHAEDGDLPLILVVDDNPELRAFLAHRLQRRYRVLQAADGHAAFELAQRELPDAIVTDWRMPGGDGVELCRRLRADAMLAGVAVLMLAGPQDASDATAALDSGADDYVAKPFDVDELLARIGGLLRARRVQRAQATATAADAAPREEDAFTRQVRERVLARLDDPDFGVAELAESLHMDRSALFRRLKQIGDRSPVEFIRDVRLAAAQERLQDGARSVSEVAYACGFESLSYFSRMFRERYGRLPREVRAARGIGTASA